MTKRNCHVFTESKMQITNVWLGGEVPTASDDVQVFDKPTRWQRFKWWLRGTFSRGQK